MSAVCMLLSLVLVMPATNAVSERSFSCLRRLNNVMVLHVHKNLTDKLSLVDIGNNFISGSSHRESLFGKFLQTECEQTQFLLNDLKNHFCRVYTISIHGVWRGVV